MSGFAAIGETGPLATTLGIGADTGSIYSIGSVVLLPQAHVHGSVQTNGAE